MVYLRQESLPGLNLYKYSGVDHSLTSKYILKPFYNNIVLPCFPMSMAPNLITLSGFMFVVVNLCTLLWYNPTLDQDCPSWVYYSWALGLFLYQTFDAVDGAQARRTRQSSPLGELFDHGVDALNTSLEVLLFAGSQNMGHGWRTVATLFASLMTFYVQTWEEYHTHTLTLGIVNGPVEGILLLVLVYALTGVLGGASFWQQPMLATLGVPTSVVQLLPPVLRGLSFTDWHMVQGGIVLVYNTVESARTVLKVWRKEKKDADTAQVANGGGGSGVNSRDTHPLLGLLPFFLTWGLVLVYLALQPEILHAHLVPFVLFVGIVNAYSVGQMITAHVAHLPFPYYNVLILPLAWGVVDSLGPLLHQLEPTVARLLFGGGGGGNQQQPPAWFVLGWPSALGDGVYQVAYMFCMLGTAVGVYGSFVVDVIVTICDYLDIWCLTIKHPYVEGAPQVSGKEAVGATNDRASDGLATNGHTTNGQATASTTAISPSAGEAQRRK
ncbi:aminoalcoholphosphotransferase [Niveomyces insectorum RCEF 264]|uniref:diacylglycerol cholinephosphotransferase n=1 Tax=Niveomyces insectorum RCEF 264 TaxID=1081102 RepID=A0A162J1H1_9HYPO|nr:aminoalcoholphosphotransferase [Niveomyces insectorum RCEF 264]